MPHVPFDTSGTTTRIDAFKLHPGDVLIGTTAEECAGPGWTNKPLWVHIRTVDGKLRTECLQPEDQPRIIAMLHHLKAWLDQRFLGILDRALVRARKKP